MGMDDICTSFYRYEEASAALATAWDQGRGMEYVSDETREAIYKAQSGLEAAKVELKAAYYRQKDQLLERIACLEAKLEEKSDA